MSEVKLYIHPLKSVNDYNKYDGFIMLFPDNPFYKKELFLNKKVENGEFFYFLMEQDGDPWAIMPFTLRKIIVDGTDSGFHDVSTTYGYSGPLFQREIAEETIRQFWKKVDEWYSENKVVSEFVRFNMMKNWVGYSGELVPTLKNVCGRILPEDEQWKNFKPKVRNNYRKAEKAGLTVVIYHENISSEIIQHFSAIYSSTMQRRKAADQYFYPLEYFSDYIRENPRNCAIAMVYKNDIPVSTELLLLSEYRVYSYLGGTDANYFSFRPNDLLKIEVLNWARKNGFTYYLLGGGRIDEDSLYHYKKDFFPKDDDAIFYTGRKIIDEEVYKKLTEINPFCTDCAVNFFFPKYRCREAC